MLDSKDLLYQSPVRSPFSDEYTEIYVWGDNNHGQLGLGKKAQNIKKSYLTPCICSFSLMVKEISCGEEHAALITTKGQIYTMGSNIHGNLGIGNRSVKQSSAPCLVESLQNMNCVQISCGWKHTVALMNYGEVYTWGIGDHGALGTGRKETEWSPNRISLDERIPLGAIRVSAGGRHTGFISELGGAYLCGSGESGQLGCGPNDRGVLSPMQIGGIREKLSDIACGSCHTLFLTESGKVYSTGSNKYGQLGTGSKRNTYNVTYIQALDAQRISKIACWNHSACLTEKGELYIWGTGVFGEYLSPVRFSKGGISLKEISIGNFFGSAVENNGRLWVWGGNAGGELGLGDYEPRVKPVLNENLAGRKTVKVSCGGNFMIVLGQTAKTRFFNGGSPVRLPIKGIGDTNSNYKTPEKGDIQWQEYGGGVEVMKTSLEDIATIRRTEMKGMEREDVYRDEFRSPVRSVVGREAIVIGNQEKGENGSERYGEGKEEGKAKTGLDPRHIELLEKQKAVLEKSLRYEREDKLALQKLVAELKAKVESLEKGPEGVAELNVKLQSQTRDLEELRETFKTEAKRREKVSEEMYEERGKARKYLDRIRQQEETIGELKRQLEKYKIEVGEKSRALEELQHDLEEEKRRNLGVVEEKLAIEDVVFKLREEVQAKRLDMEKSERLRFIEEKRQYELEAKNMENKMREIDETLNKSRKDLEKEDLVRKQLQEQLDKHNLILEDAQSEVKRLCRENEMLKNHIRVGPESSVEKLAELEKSIEQKRAKISSLDYSWDIPKAQDSMWSRGNTGKSVNYRKVSESENVDLGGRTIESEGYVEDESLGGIMRDRKGSEGSEVKQKRELTFRDEDVHPVMKVGGPLDNLKQVRERLEFLKNSKQTLEGKLMDFTNKVSELNG